MKKYSIYYLPLIIIAVGFLVSFVAGGLVSLATAVPIVIIGLVLLAFRSIKSLNKQEKVSQGSRIIPIIFATIAIFCFITLLLFFLFATNTIHLPK